MHISNGKFDGVEILDAPHRPVLTPRELTVKEEIFNLIGSRVAGAEVLDVNDFNGMYGIEALSRNAKNVHFISDNLNTNEVIAQNIRILKIHKQSVLINEAVKEFLNELSETIKFGLIFFEVEKPTELNLISEIALHLIDEGLMIVNIPINSKFEIPTDDDIENCCIQETRDCEQKKILVISKACES